VGCLQLATTIPLRTPFVFLRSHSVAVNRCYRGVVLSQGESENRIRRTRRVARCSKDSEILAAGFSARLCVLRCCVPDWRYPNGCELPSDSSRMAVALVVVQRGYVLSLPHGDSVVDSRTNLQNEHGHHPRDGPDSFSEFRRPVTPSEFHKRSQGTNTSPVAGVFLAVQPYRAQSARPI
jgi:hypothetical protein